MKLSSFLPIVTLPLAFPKNSHVAANDSQKYVNWQDPRDPAYSSALDSCLQNVKIPPARDLLNLRDKEIIAGNCDSEECLQALIDANKGVCIKSGDFKQGVIIVVKQIHLGALEFSEGINGRFFQYAENYEPLSKHQAGIYCFLEDLHKLLGSNFIGLAPESASNENIHDVPEMFKNKFEVKNSVRDIDFEIANTFMDLLYSPVDKVLAFRNSAFNFLVTHPNLEAFANSYPECKEYVVMHSLLASQSAHRISNEQIKVVLTDLNIAFDDENFKSIVNDNAKEIRNYIRTRSIQCRDFDVINGLIEKISTHSEKSLSEQSCQNPQVAAYVVGAAHNISQLLEKEYKQDFKGVIYEIPLSEARQSQIVQSFENADKSI